jgi:uncharacterized protein YbbC (DUF1343 family)
MGFNMFKNTVLLFLLIMISCGSNDRKKSAQNNEMLRQAQHDITNSIDSTIIVGANQIENYLPLLKGKRVGIVANQTSVIFKVERQKTKDKSYTHLVDSLLSLDIDVKKVFAPEHGFRGTADAGENIKDGFDIKTGLPILSLHGKNKKPTEEQIKDIDIMVFDIQDVGVRFYTYISSLHYVMEACAEQNIPLLILDRPNPNGNYIDGPTLEPEHKSFLGMHTIPLVHGMTIGEYAQMINGEQWLANGVQCKISIISIKNYTHKTSYSLPIRPSPNLPNDQSIKLYPSLGLFEGTNVNTGRGTEFQFQRFGAPFLDKNVFSLQYTPKENFGAKNPKHKGELCYGEDLSNKNINQTISLKWLIKAYINTSDKSLFFNEASFTKHVGTKKLQEQIEAGLTEIQIKETWQESLEAFKIIRKKYLIYK